MRHFVIGVPSRNKRTSWQRACEYLPFVQVLVSPLHLFAREAKLDAEILPHYFVHEQYGGRPQVGVSSLLPTYGVRGSAPWVISIPPLKVGEWKTEYNRAGEPELILVRHISLQEELRQGFEAVFRTLVEYDRVRPNVLCRIGLHVDTALSAYRDLPNLPVLVAEILSQYADYFTASDCPTEVERVRPEAEPVIALREWYRRYHTAQVNVSHLDISLLKGQWYKLVEASLNPRWMVVELASSTTRLTLFLLNPLEASVGLVEDADGYAGSELLVSGVDTGIVVLSSISGDLVGSWARQGYEVRFRSAYV